MIIQNKIISIYGLPGSGKTFFALFLQSFYLRVYSNVDFIRYSAEGKIIKKSNRIECVGDLENIDYSDQKGIAILDEGGINISSRRSMSDTNLEFLKLGMLARKKNIDIISISQLERSLDVVIRELSKVSFTMCEFWEDKKLKFEATAKGRYDELKGIYTFDLIKFSELTGWTYNSKEESIIKKGTSKEFKNLLQEI